MIFDNASRYHFYHSLALLGVPFARWPILSAILFAGGMTMFCGSCYYQSLTGDDRFKRITPYGGTMLILAWVSLIF